MTAKPAEKNVLTVLESCFKIVRVGQFGNAEITAVATMLDRKMEDLAAKAIGLEVNSG